MALSRAASIAAPGVVERMPVKVDDAVRLHRSRAQFSIPRAVQRRARPNRRRRRFWRHLGRCGPRLGYRRARLRLAGSYFRASFIERIFTRKRSNGRCDASPEVFFLRAERSGHVAAPPRDRRCLSVRERRRHRWPTCRPQSAWLPVHGPRRCRTGSIP